MAILAKWTFTGGNTTIVSGLEKANTGLAQWEARVCEFIAKIAEVPDFRIKDNGYRRFPGVLVTNGVRGYFRDKPFELWSDVPGELILRHESMGYRLGSELVERLKELWS